MTKTKLYFCLILTVFTLTNAFGAIDFSAETSRMATQIISDPGRFFFETQQDLEITAPVIIGKKASANVGILPSLAPMGMANLSAKFRLLSERRLLPCLPQIDIVSGYWNMIWTSLAANNSDEIKSADFSGYYFGVITSYTVNPKTRLFGGLKHCQLNANLELNETKEILGAQVNSFNSGFADNLFTMGIEHLIKAESRLIASFSYGLEQKTVAAKVSRSGKYFEFGINIYPEGVFAIHPVLNFHIDF
ncbi:MAG TPA: hypothetical protein VMW66_04825 [Elusimicrobiales bacterium]|nr:hypothetical protein [Elusimicrobiales bacterium]